MVGGYKWSSSPLFTYLPFNGLPLYMSIRQKSNAVTITNFMVVVVVVVVVVSTNDVTHTYGEEPVLVFSSTVEVELTLHPSLTFEYQ